MTFLLNSKDRSCEKILALWISGYLKSTCPLRLLILCPLCFKTFQSVQGQVEKELVSMISGDAVGAL